MASGISRQRLLDGLTRTIWLTTNVWRTRRRSSETFRLDSIFVAWRWIVLTYWPKVQPLALFHSSVHKLLKGISESFVRSIWLQGFATLTTFERQLRINTVNLPQTIGYLKIVVMDCAYFEEIIIYRYTHTYIQTYVRTYLHTYIHTLPLITTNLNLLHISYKAKIFKTMYKNTF